MQNTKVVNLGQVKDLMAEWDKVRQGILVGRVEGWAATLRCADGREVVYLGGVYKTDRALASRAALKQSAARMLAEDEPLHVNR